MINTITSSNYSYKNNQSFQDITGNNTSRNYYKSIYNNSQNNVQSLEYNTEYSKRNLIPLAKIEQSMTNKPVERLLEHTGDTVATATITYATQSSGKTGRDIKQKYIISKTALDLSLGTVMNAATRYQNRTRISKYKCELVKRETKSILEKGGTKEQVRNAQDTILKKKFNIIEQEELGKINKVLRSNGLEPIRANGRNLEKIAAHNLRKNRNKYSKEVIEALNKARRLGQTGIYNVLPATFSIRNITNQTKKMANFAFMQFARNGGESGQGLYTIYSIGNKASVLLKANLKVVRRINRSGRKLIKQAALRHNITKLNKLKKQKEKLIKLKSIGKNTDKTQKKINKLKKSVDRNKNKRIKQRIKQRGHLRRPRHKLRNKLNSFMGKITDKMSGSKIGRGILKIGKGITNTTKFGGKLVKKIMNIITAPIAALKFVLATIKKYIMIGIGIIILLYFLLIAIINAMVGILSIFDLSKATNKEIITDYLQTLYVSDLKYMVYVHEGYYINFQDIRNQEAYDTQLEGFNNDSESTDDINNSYWTQSTNGAEILSMAYVYYNYGFEDENINELKNYVSNLYYGSHEIITDDSLCSCTFKTTYFDKLFTVEGRSGEIIDRNIYGGFAWYDGFAGDEMYHSPETITESNMGQLTENEKLLYDTLKNLGYSDMSACAIMGNASAESGLDPTIDNKTALGIFQFDYASGIADDYKTWCDNNGKDYYTIENQCEYLDASLSKDFQSYTGCSYIYTYGRRNQTSGAYEAKHKDASYYHVWVMTSYSLTDFKNWSENSNLTSELVEDYKKHGDTNIGDGEEVTNYIKGLNDKDESMIYATLLFTRVYERPHTGGGNYCTYLNNWISTRCMKAIEYYHKVRGFEGEIVPYRQSYYQTVCDNVGSGACVSTSFAMACASVGIKGNSGYLYNVSDAYAPTGYHADIYPNAYGTSAFYWNNAENLLKQNGAIKLGKDEENDTSVKGIKYRIFTSDMTKEYLESELLEGHMVMLRVGSTQTGFGSRTHTVLAVGIENGKIIIAEPAFSDTSPTTWNQDTIKEIEEMSDPDIGYGPCKRVLTDNWGFGNMEGYSCDWSTVTTLIIWKD